MLLIDGVKYKLWTPANEDEFEQVVKEHTQEIFGEQSIYIDRKQKLKSLSGIGSIPDGYVIILGFIPQWHIVEAELSSHPLDQHIVAQVSRFITGIKNPNTQRDIVRAMYDEITKDGYLKLKVEEAIKPTEIYKFLFDLISKPPILTIIIEKDTEGLREAISTLAHSGIKIVEFQTYLRDGAGLTVHAHLFEPLNTYSPQSERKSIINIVIKPKGIEEQKRVTVKDLVDSGFLKAGQIIYRTYNNQRYEGKILDDGGIELVHTGKSSDSLSDAAKDIAGSVNGWIWWYTKRENGAECLVDELRKEYRAIHPSNT